jgi:protein SCO1/2
MRLAVLALIALTAACAPRATLTPRTTESLRTSAADRLAARFPNVELVLDDGTPIRFYDDCLRGRNVILSFTYTRCRGSCPLTHARLAAVRDALGDRVGRDVAIWSISLDSERDTPDVLQGFAARQGAGPQTGWRFVTGDKQAIERVRRSLGLYDPDPAIDADLSQHAGILVFGSEPEGKWQSIATLADSDDIVRAFERVTRRSGRAATTRLPVASLTPPKPAD